MVSLLLVVLLLAAPAAAQYYPGDRTDTDPTRQRTRRNQPGVTAEGPTRAPDDPAELPENRLPVPAPEDTSSQPPTIDDPGFANAIRAAVPGIVRINMPDDRKALGFLIDGPDDEHKFVVTNFLSVAPRDYSHRHWVDIRTEDWTRLEVEGLAHYDELQDLAVIQVKASKSRKVGDLELAAKDPKAADKVYPIGYRRALVDWAAIGTVQKIEEGSSVGAPFGSQWLRTDAVITHANRGGPLMDRRGKVVGLCTSTGKRGRGPHLAVPVSVIRKLLDREPSGSGRFPIPDGAFRWPELDEKQKVETFSYSRVFAAASSVKRSLDCKKCKGFGYLVTPVYQVNQTTGATTKTGEKREVCEECGGAGVLIKPSIYELLSTVSLGLLNPDEKIDEGQMARLKATAQEGFDRAAVNRLLLADALTPAAMRILGDFDKNRGQAVTFLATQGPRLGRGRERFLWVKPYDSDQWLLTYGADVRSPSGTSAPPAQQRTSRRRRRQPQPRASAAYVLVSGVLTGTAVVEDNKKVYSALLLKAADIVILRP